MASYRKILFEVPFCTIEKFAEILKDQGILKNPEAWRGEVHCPLLGFFTVETQGDTIIIRTKNWEALVRTYGN